MSPLRQALQDYLAVRRALGYRLQRPEKLLAQFLTYVEARGEAHLRLATMVTWATLPAGASRSWVSHRLSVIRGFASHVHALDPATDVPPADLLPSRPSRATPYLYSEPVSTAARSASGGDRHHRGVGVHGRHPPAVLQCPLDLPPVGPPSRAHASVRRLPSPAS
jgi:hypothetical protein